MAHDTGDNSAHWTRREFSIAAAALGASVAMPAGAAGNSQAAAAPRFPLVTTAGDRFAALLAYRPQHDPDAAFFRSQVPRSRTIAPFQPTQAHAALDPRPQLASLTGCYRSLGRAPVDTYKAVRYGVPPPGGVYVSRQVGSHDILVSWSGPGLVPNPALTDAAHRNGARCLGIIFQPDHRMYDGSSAPARTVARRLAALAQWFGFDGYFVNFENGTPAQHVQVQHWMSQMREEATRLGMAEFYLQFYDGSADMEKLFPARAGSPDSWADSTMLDQGWSGYSMTHGCCSGVPTTPASVAAYCTAHHFDRFRTAFFGFQLYPGPGYLGIAAPAVITPDTAADAFGSLQIYSWDDGLYNLAAYRRQRSAAASSEGGAAFYKLERLFFSGQSGNPAGDNGPTPAQARAYAEVAGGTRRYSGETSQAEAATEQIRLPLTWGVRDFITERSVVGAVPFVSRFNVGSGSGFWLAGEQVSREPWFHLGAQDILPTWQWWQHPLHNSRAVLEAPLTIDYDLTAAWNGGACLRIAGSIPAEGATVRLYKTDLLLTGTGHCVQMVWRGEAPMPSAPLCGLVFADAPETTVWLTPANLENVGAGWVRGTYPLAPYAGRTVAALSLGLESPGPFDARIGEVFVGPAVSSVPVSRPQGFRVQQSARTGDRLRARLHWRLDPAVLYYDVFLSGRQAKRWLGRITADCFYAETDAPADQGPWSFLLTATGKSSPQDASRAAQVRL